MITAEEIRRKALNLYPAWQLAWLEEEGFFPRAIPFNRTIDANLAAAVASMHELRAGSKEVRGFGYSIEWEERRSRAHGRNRFPKRILFETRSDLLRFVGREREFSLFERSVGQLRDRYPALEPWIRSHRRDLIDAAADLEGLLQVTDYFVAHPRPGTFAREIPVPVDTKFIERNRTILRGWLDQLLPAYTIRADEDQFDRRFGLRYQDSLIFVRFLDESLRRQAGSPWSECAVPLHSLAASPIAADRVLIVENKVNLRTLPSIPGAIALGGLGNGVTDLRYLQWLTQREIWYWGDIDVDGLAILSRLRTFLPHTRSLLMDDDAVRNWRQRIGSVGNGRTPEVPPGLTPTEFQAFLICSRENLRIEQERIPQADLLEYLAERFRPAGEL